ncbi:uncharacterized protein [Dermacentor albipictus]|uniref:uncharacterized protein isoform X4 n=1 Tax=Dermacentor albipictus TaxID=60249 RepID=UPI0038FC3CEF
MDGRVNLRFPAVARRSILDDFPVAHGRNSGATNGRAKFRFPSDKASVGRRRRWPFVCHHRAKGLGNIVAYCTSQAGKDTPVARGSNKPGTDSRVKDDFPVVHGSNSGGTNSGAKFRFPGDKDFPMAHEANNGETDCLASFPLLSIQALKTLIILVHPVGLHCLRTYKLTVNVPPLEVARAIILTRKTDKREMIGAQPAHVKP